MTSQIPLRCRCGQVQGVAIDLAPTAGNHIVCYCDDCQAYAHWLGTEGLLDAHGGTNIFQMTPAQLRITHGHEHVRCMRLSDKGMLRWYAGCCRTPIGNTLTPPRLPFVGLVLSFVDPAIDATSRTAAFGAPLYRVMGRFAIGDAPAGSHPGVPPALIWRSLRKLTRGFLRRAYRPSPFFDAESDQPVVTPHVLTRDERDRLRTPTRAVA